MNATNNQGDPLGPPIAILLCTGSTNSVGFASIDLTLNNSLSNTDDHVNLWCSNCTAGSNNTTWLDNVEVPNSEITPNMWGRNPDGTGAWVITLSTTRDSANLIPEFSDVFAPLVGLTAMMALVGRRR